MLSVRYVYYGLRLYLLTRKFSHTSHIFTQRHEGKTELLLYRMYKEQKYLHIIPLLVSSYCAIFRITIVCSLLPLAFHESLFCSLFMIMTFEA